MNALANEGAGEYANLLFVRSAFERTKCEYALNIEHELGNSDENTTDKAIRVNMLSNSALTFPCELHELIYVFPNMTCLPPGATFGGIEEIAKMSGKIAEHTGIERAPMERGGAPRLLSMPPHEYSITYAGKFTLSFATTHAHAKQQIVGSENEKCLFSCDVVQEFMKEVLRRVEWLQTERFGTHRSLCLSGNTLLQGQSLATQRVSVVSLNDTEPGINRVIPRNVEFVKLSFRRAKEHANDILAEFINKGSDMYAIPPPDDPEDLTKFDSSMGWSSDSVRTIIERRLEKWNDAARDRTETPWLRQTKEQRKMRQARQAADADVFAPRNTAAAKRINEQVRQKRIEELKALESKAVGDKTYKYVKKHTFFHTANESPMADWTDNLDWMLLATQVVYKNQREWSEQTASDKRDTVKKALALDKLGAATKHLYTLLSLVPVYETREGNTFSCWSLYFRRLLHLLSNPAAREALTIAVNDASAVGTSDRSAYAVELYIRLNQFRTELRTRRFEDVPEFDAVNETIEKINTKSTYFKNTVFDFLRTVDPASTVADLDGKIDIIVKTSPYGDDPLSLNPVPIAPRRDDFINAIKSAILRLFYDPDADKIAKYFTKTS